MILLLHLLDVTIKTVWDRGLFSAPEVSHRKQIKYNSERVEQQQQIRNKRKSKGKKCLGSKKLWYLHSYLPFFISLSIFFVYTHGRLQKTQWWNPQLLLLMGQVRDKILGVKLGLFLFAKDPIVVFFLCSTRVSLKSTGGPSFFPSAIAWTNRNVKPVPWEIGIPSSTVGWVLPPVIGNSVL